MTHNGAHIFERGRCHPSLYIAGLIVTTTTHDARKGGLVLTEMGGEIFEGEGLVD